jgi:uncharacterized protein (TIGR02217 family)
MSFLEDPRFPDDIAVGATGGANYLTEVAIVDSSDEFRDQVWENGIGRWDVVHGVKNPAQMRVLQSFHRCVKGKAHGFRFKDWSDFYITPGSGEGWLNEGWGDGTPQYLLHKRYATGALSETRRIRKPVVSMVTALRGGVAVPVGASPGQLLSIDYTTGTIIIRPDAQSNATSITVGATTQVVLAANPGALVPTQYLYLAGFGGADASLVNDLPHLITSITGSGPYTFTLATNTAGSTITFSGGTGYKYPQPSESMRWEGEFDVPVRFNVDGMRMSIDSYDVYSWNQIPIVELLRD